MVISAFIVAYLVHAIIHNSPFRIIPRRVIRWYVLLGEWAGIDYNWSMYAPDAPIATDLVELHLEMPNGSRREITPPFLNVRDDFNRTSHLRFLTYQRRLRHSGLLRRGLLNFGDIRFGAAGVTDYSDRIVFEHVSLKTATFFCKDPDHERTIEVRPLGQHELSTSDRSGNYVE
ncbi:MAG: hypothetical protein HKN13_14235 [Rhodothermales bacterium]|nr:hypothetical protein [Rhodothermales bacterium]